MDKPDEQFELNEQTEDVENIRETDEHCEQHHEQTGVGVEESDEVHETSQEVHETSRRTMPSWKDLGWKKNPFIFDISPEKVVGYEEQRKSLMDYISQGHKALMLTGPTGAGKTTMLKWAQSRLDNVVFFSKPPSSVDEMVDFFNYTYPRKFIFRLFGPRFRTMYDVLDYLRKKRVIIFVDEAHESPEEILEWLRVMTDQIPDVTIVVAGLPKLGALLREKVETFYQRISMKIELGSLSYDEMKQMIRTRIESVGGTGTEPFDEEMLKKIYTTTGGFPREVLRACDRIINGLEQTHEMERISALPELTSMQMEVVNILMEQDMTPTEIVSMMDLSKYKSKHHALRSVNNVLKQLLDMGFVRREKMGRSYVYSLLPRIRNILVEA